ncbi:DUF4184 family protein [Mucilaginibacter gynuensis]|uniref:DUF4184 family protein n=1 Tax=Mucilaginibacter gynuensis TaxID=1302236 RepID=UPI0031E8F7CF
MPFTFCHPAIVLPLGYLPKRVVSVSALVIGSMAPDFEYFFRMRIFSIYSHTWDGLLWFDLPVGLFVLLIYLSLVKNVLIDHLPEFLNKRFSSFKNPPSFRFSNAIIAVLCILLGAISHILWDGFTHKSGYFVAHIPALSIPVTINHTTLYVYNIVQHASSLLGLLVILYAIWKLPVGLLTIKRPIFGYWLVVITITLLIVIARFAISRTMLLVGNVIVSAISASFIALVITSAYYRLKNKHNTII